MQSFIFTEKIRYFGYSQSQRADFILSVTHIRSYQDLVLLPEDCGVLVVVVVGGGGGGGGGCGGGGDCGGAVVSVAVGGVVVVVC